MSLGEGGASTPLLFPHPHRSPPLLLLPVGVVDAVCPTFGQNRPGDSPIIEGQGYPRLITNLEVIFRPFGYERLCARCDSKSSGPLGCWPAGRLAGLMDEFLNGRLAGWLPVRWLDKWMAGWLAKGNCGRRPFAIVFTCDRYTFPNVC